MRFRVARTAATLTLLQLLIPLPFVSGQAPDPVKLKTRIELPSVNGRIDHFGVDIKGQRLFVAAFDNHSLEVIDLQAGKRVKSLTGFANPQAAIFDASTNRLLVSSSADGTVKVFDGTKLQLLATVKLSADADNLRYDERSKTVVVGYGGEKFLRGRPVRGHGDGALAFLDTSGNKKGEIPLDAHPESFQLEKAGDRVYVNVPDHKEVEVADVVKRRVLARWPVTACTDNFPMALDEAHHRLFVGCRTPARMLVFDTVKGEIVTTFPMAELSDDLFYDESKGRIYVLGEGSIEVFQQKDADHYDLIKRYPTPPHAHTGRFVPEWGELVTAVPRQGEQNAEILVYDTQ